VLLLEQVRKVANQSAPHTAEYCLYRAVECDQKAEECANPKNKQIFFDLAIRWRELAQQSGDGKSLNPIGKPRTRASPE
jgi:hypothetical protein